MQTSQNLIRKYFHVRMGHKLAGIIGQVDAESLLAARILGSDFTAVLYCSAKNENFIPVAYQYGSHLSIRAIDTFENQWKSPDIDRLGVRTALDRATELLPGGVPDEFAQSNGFASRFLYPVVESDGAIAVIAAYWFETPDAVSREAEVLLSLVGQILMSSLAIADQLMTVENYSTRLSELLPLFDVPLGETKFSQLVTQIVGRATQIVPDAYFLLLSRNHETGTLTYREHLGGKEPTDELIEHVRSRVEPMTQVQVSEAGMNDTHKFRCRDLSLPEGSNIVDLVSLPIAPSDNLNLILCVGLTSERGLSQNDRELLSVFAVFAQTVLRNALLVKRLKKANRLLEHSSDRLANAEAMAALTDMTSGVAHDFNNIFGGIIGRVQLMKIRLKDDPRTAEELEKIETLVTDGAETVRRIQEFTTSGRTKNLEPLDFVEIVHTAVDDPGAPWVGPAREKDVHVSLKCLVDEAAVDGSDDDLITMVLKLIENAVEHAPPASTVNVVLEGDERKVRLTVQDNGQGISPANAKKVFYPFFTTKNERGRGLGLAIVHGIVSRHSGKVTFDSSPETGTSFVVTLNRRLTESEATDITTRSTRRQENLRILVVDDDEQIRDVLSDMLSVSGHKAVGCSDGYQALEVLETDCFDLMITDLGMPGMSGLELAGTAHEQHPQMPIAMITGWGTQLDQNEIAHKGILAVLPKPFRIKDIKSLVDEITAA